MDIRYKSRIIQAKQQRRRRQQTGGEFFFLHLRTEKKFLARLTRTFFGDDIRRKRSYTVL